MRNREGIYDEQINPLMARIIAICKEHDIPFTASFQLTDGLDEDGEVGEQGPMHCTSANLPDWTEERLVTMKNVAMRGTLASWLHDMRNAGLVPVPMGADDAPAGRRAWN